MIAKHAKILEQLNDIWNELCPPESQGHVWIMVASMTAHKIPSEDQIYQIFWAVTISMETKTWPTKQDILAPIVD